MQETCALSLHDARENTRDFTRASKDIKIKHFKLTAAQVHCLKSTAYYCYNYYGYIRAYAPCLRDKLNRTMTTTLLPKAILGRLPLLRTCRPVRWWCKIHEMGRFHGIFAIILYNIFMHGLIWLGDLANNGILLSNMPVWQASSD